MFAGWENLLAKVYHIFTVDFMDNLHLVYGSLPIDKRKYLIFQTSQRRTYGKPFRT